MDLLSLRKISFAKLPNQVSISPWPTDDGHVLMTLRERKGMNIHRVTTAWCGGENTEHPGPEGLVARAKSAALWLHLPQYPLCPSTQLQMARFSSFSWIIFYCMYVYNHTHAYSRLLYPFIIDGKLCSPFSSTLKKKFI